jgi:RNA polymerase sigma factor (sigma-70 family)
LSDAARRLVADHLALVGLHLKRRVPTPGVPRRDREYRDLFQEGCLALIKAAAEYVPQRHGAFPPYALLRIRRGVYEALHDQFTLMRVPGWRHTATAEQELSPSERIGQIPPGTLLRAKAHIGGHVETLRHRFHRRYERALRLALRDVKNHTWRRRDPTPVLERLAAERLLITQECMRTPLRQIARETGISPGRVSGYEQRLTEAATAYLRDDPQLPVLLRWIKDNHGDFDAVLDDELNADLERAEDRAFNLRFVSLPAQERARLIYDLLDRCETEVAEMACNLHRMVRNTEADPCADPLCA